MTAQSVKRLLHHTNSSLGYLRKHDSGETLVYNVLKRYQPLSTDASGKPAIPEEENNARISKYNPSDNDFSNNKWKLEIDWLAKAVEPAMQFYRWALPTGNADGSKPAPSSKSVAEIIASIQRSKLGLQDWSLSDFTIGLYLIYLQQASTNPFEDVKGEKISSDSIVQDLIYHIELAKGAYKDNAKILAKYSMLRESNVVKFEKNSSVLRPGYYIGVDHRKKLVILGIRGTHTVYDLITDIISSSNEEVTSEGYSTHFGTAESARWFLAHEMGTVKACLEKHKGYRLRLVGHSLGGATASLLATMLREKSQKELGFSPEIVTAVGYATPPCVSKELAESCSDYVTTIVMQDDIIPRLSAASLARLRNEILQIDCATVFKKEDWKSVVDLVTNAKEFVSSVQDVARKLADYTKFRNQTKFLEIPNRKESVEVSEVNNPKEESTAAIATANATACSVPEELFVPGSVYYLKRNIYSSGVTDDAGKSEFFTLWKRQPGEHFQRILLSNNIISDHKCDSHYHALRDVLKGFPGSQPETIFR